MNNNGDQYLDSPVILYVEDEIEAFDAFKQAFLQLCRRNHVNGAVIERHSSFRPTDVTRKLLGGSQESGTFSREYDLLLLDLKSRDDAFSEPHRWAGVRCVQELRTEARLRNFPMIALTDYGFQGAEDPDAAVGFLRAGGTDVLTKLQVGHSPGRTAWFHKLMAYVALSRWTRGQIVGAPAIDSRLKGEGRFVREFRQHLGRLILNGTRFICIHGESGVGKGAAVGEICSLLARVRQGGLMTEKPSDGAGAGRVRRSTTGTTEGAADASHPSTVSPMIRSAHIQLQAIPESLVEAYLFGTVAGAYTNATDTLGAIVDKDLVYFDEFQRLTLQLQDKLLRILRERKYSRLGEHHIVRTIGKDVLFIVSFDEQPLKLVDQGRLDPHIFGRLPRASIEIQPLRRRKDEIPDLVRHFMSSRASRTGLTGNLSIEDAAIQRLVDLDYDWPYNIGELEMVVEQICDERDGDVVKVGDVERVLSTIVPDELHRALDIYRRYCFNHTLAANCLRLHGTPGGHFVSVNSDGNTFGLRRSLLAAAARLHGCKDLHVQLPQFVLRDRLDDIALRDRFDTLLLELHRDYQKRCQDTSESTAINKLLNLSQSPEYAREGLAALEAYCLKLQRPQTSP